MPISPYLRALRARVGTARLLLPSVSAHMFDASDRLLLVRQRDSRVWSTPGGVIEPDERPAEAVIREAREETGLLVRPSRLQGVYGGPEFVVRYPNGDEVQYVIAAFECEVESGTLQGETDEIEEARFVDQDTAGKLELSPWLRATLSTVYAREKQFEPPAS